MEGDGMIAVVRGLKDSSLCVTLLDRNGQYTFLPNAATKTQGYSNNKTQTVSQSTGEVHHHGPKCDSSAQAVDSRYASVYKTTHCNMLPTSPLVESTEFPPQKPEVCRGHGNFQVGGLGSGELKFRSSRTSSYKGGLSWPDRGSVCTARRSSEQCSFANSLRKYPSTAISPERSCEILERLINYTQIKNCQKQQHRSPSKKFEPDIRIDESPTKERARRGDTERRFERTYDVRYLSPRRGKNSQVTYSNQVCPTIKERVNSLSPLPKLNTTKSVDTETQAQICLASRGVATLPPKTTSVKNVAISPLPTSSISEDLLPKLSKSIQTLTLDLTLHIRKSVQTCFSSIDISGRKLEIGHRRSKSQEYLRVNDLDDQIVTLVQDLSLTDGRESVRDEVLKKLLEIGDSDNNKRFRLRNNVRNDKLVVKLENKEVSHEIVPKDNNSNVFNQQINVFRAELQSKYKDLPLDDIIKDWLLDIPIMTYLAKNIKNEQLIHIVATNIKSIFDNKSELESEKVLRNEILDLIKDIPIDFKNNNRKYYLNKLVTKLVRKVKDSVTPVSKSKIILKPFMDNNATNFGNTFEVYDTVNKIDSVTKEDEVRTFVRGQLLDFINKFQLKICTESIEELEFELHEITLDSFDYIRNGKDDRLKHEVLGVLFDFLKISDKLGKYFATNLVLNLKEKYKEIPQLKTRSFVILNDDKNNNQEFMESINNKDTKSNLKWYRDQVVLKINEWISEATELNISDTNTKIAINDLAGNIIDRIKYLDLNPSIKGIDNEIEHLKYQIFQSMNRLVDENNLNIIELAPDLMKKIKSIPVPNITKATIDYEEVLAPRNEKSIVQVKSDEIMSNNQISYEPVHIVSYSEIKSSCQTLNSNDSWNDKNSSHQKPCCDKSCSSQKSEELIKSYCPNPDEIAKYCCRIKKSSKRTGSDCHKRCPKKKLTDNVDCACATETEMFSECIADMRANDCCPSTLGANINGPGRFDNTLRTLPSRRPGVSCSVPCGSDMTAKTLPSSGPYSMATNTTAPDSFTPYNMSVAGATGISTQDVVINRPDTMMYGSPIANSTIQESVVSGTMTPSYPMPFNMSVAGQVPESNIGSPAAGGAMSYSMNTGSMPPETMLYGTQAANTTIPGSMVPGSMTPGSRRYNKSAPGGMQGGLVDTTMPYFRDYEGTIPSAMVSESMTPGSPTPYHTSATGNTQGLVGITMPDFRDYEGTIPNAMVSESMIPGSPMPYNINATGQSPCNMTACSNFRSGALQAQLIPLSMRPDGLLAGSRVTDSMSLGTSPANMTVSSTFPSGSPQAHSTLLGTRPYGLPAGGGVTDSMSPGTSPANMTVSSTFPSGSPQAHSTPLGTRPKFSPRGSGIPESMFPSTAIPSTSKAYTGTGRPQESNVCVKGPSNSGTNSRRCSVPSASHSPALFQGSAGKRYSSPAAFGTAPKLPADCRESCCNLPLGFPNLSTLSGMQNTCSMGETRRSILMPQAARSRTGSKRVTLNAQPIISNISDNTSHTVHELNKDFDQFLKSWVENIPIAEIPEIAAKARLGLYNGIWMEIIKLKLNPEAVNNPAYYQAALDGVVDELLDCLPEIDELIKVRNNLKQELLNKAADINQFTSIAVLPSSYKQQLIDNVTNNLPSDTNDTNYCLQEEIINQIAENFIMYTKYKDTDSTKSHIYKTRLFKEIRQLISNINQTQGVDAKSTADAIIHALERVPIPNDEVVNIEADKILLGHEVEQWFFDLPLEKTQDDKELIVRVKLSQVLAKNLHDIEKSNNNEQEMKEKIKHFLTKVPVRSEDLQNIDFMVDELLNRLKTRPTLSDRRNSIGFSDYDEFSKNMPLCSSFHDDHGHSSYMIVDGQRVDQNITCYRPPQNRTVIPDSQIEWLSLEETKIPPELQHLQENLLPPCCSKTIDPASASFPGPSNLRQLQSSCCQTSIPKPQGQSSCCQTSFSKPQGQSSCCQTSISKSQEQSSCCQTSISKPQRQPSCCQASIPKPQGHSSGCQTLIPKSQGQSCSCQTIIPKPQGHSSSCQVSFPRPDIAQAHSCCQTEGAIPKSCEENRASSQMRDLQVAPPCTTQASVSTPYQTPVPSKGPICECTSSGHSIRQPRTQAKAVSCCMDQSSRHHQNKSRTPVLKHTQSSMQTPPRYYVEQQLPDIETSESSQMQYEAPVSIPEPCCTSRQIRSDQIRHESQYRDTSPIPVETHGHLRKFSSCRNDRSNRSRRCKRQKNNYRTPEILESATAEDVSPRTLKPLIEVCESSTKMRRVPCMTSMDLEDSESEIDRGLLRMCVCMQKPRRRPRPRQYRPYEDSDVEYVPLCPLKYGSIPPCFY